MEPMLNIAVKAARLAGKHILRGFDRPDLLKVNSKGHNDLVTNIDRESEQIITGTLLDAWPHHKITGEESGSSDSDADYEWVIDPAGWHHEFLAGRFLIFAFQSAAFTKGGWNMPWCWTRYGRRSSLHPGAWVRGLMAGVFGSASERRLTARPSATAAETRKCK